MGLRIEKNSFAKLRPIATLMMIFALVAQPMYGSMAGYVASALAPGEVSVADQAGLEDALANDAVGVIKFAGHITTAKKLVLSRSNVTIDAGHKRLTMAGDTKGWQGNYVLQVYRAANVTLKNTNISGGDAAIYVNGSQVQLAGNNHVTGNEFGGIEVSRGVNVTETPNLSVVGNIYNYSEHANRPTVWVDSLDQHYVSSSLYSQVKPTVKNGQVHYYRTAEVTGAVAVNNETRKVFDSIQAAIDDIETQNGHTIKLLKDTSLSDKSVRITKQVVIDGNGTTVSTPFVRGEGGVRNATFVVLANNVEIKNVTTVATFAANPTHGIVVDQGLSGVKLANVTTKNGTAGVIVNSADVVIDGIHTSGNKWGGVNIDDRYGPAKLTISGANTHTEGSALYIDDREMKNAVVKDVNNQYVRFWEGAGYKYVLDSTKPVVSINQPVGAMKNDAKITVKASDDVSLDRIDVSIYDDSDTVQKKIWGDWISYNTGQEKTFVYEDKFKDLPDGTYTVRATVADSLKKSTDAVSVKFTIDNSAPIVNITAPSASGVHSGAVDIKATIADAHLSHYYLLVKTRTDSSQPWSELYKKTVTSDQFVDSETLYTVPATVSGEVYVQLEARDKLGNKSNTQSVKKMNFTMDNKAPVLTVDNINDIPELSTLVLSGTAADENGIRHNAAGDTTKGAAHVKVTFYELDQDGNNAQALTTGLTAQVDGDGNWSYELKGADYQKLVEDRKYRVAVTAYDNAGTSYAEANATQQVINFYIDRVPLAVSFAGYNAGTLSGDAQGTDSVKVAIEGQTPVNVPVVNGGWSYKVPTGLTAGTYNLKVSATDALGKSITLDNVNGEALSFTVPSASNTPVSVTQPTFPGLPTLNEDDAPTARTVAAPVGATFFGYDVSDLVAQANNAPVDTPAVAGAQDNRDTLGASSKAVEATPDGWKIFGMAWYWWLLIVAAVAGAGWWLLAAARRKREDEPSFLG